jgi:DNA modification methylase
MSERDSLQKVLFEDDGRLDDNMNFVIEDAANREKYQIEEIKNRIISGDAFKVLKKIDDEVFDMVFIDPPYFLQLPNKELRRWTVKTLVEGVNDEWDKFSSFEEYDDFITRLFYEVKRVMKPKGTIWVIATYHSIFRIGKIMQDLGYWILNDVIWVKTNPMPNWLGVRFTNATETLVWAVKDKRVKGYHFNKDYAKMFGIGKVGANVWVLPLCWGVERLKTEGGHKLHSTQKPVELLKRVILTSTKEGDLVLDPVAGTGTTGYVAHALRRNFVMIEINANYVKGAVERFRRCFKITERPCPGKRYENQYMKLEEPR